MSKILRVVGTVVSIVAAVATAGASLALNAATGTFLGVSTAAFSAIALGASISPLPLPPAAIMIGGPP
jgi:hypothetical protein